MVQIWMQECRNYFHSAAAYVFIAGMLCVQGVSTYVICLSGREPAYEKTLEYTALAFMLTAPILAMHIFSEERKDGILSFYMSLPVNMRDIVIGKYLALLCVLTVPLAVSVLYPAMLSRFGSLSTGIIAGTYIGLFAMCAALLSISVFFSVLLENTVSAAIATFLTVLGLYFIPRMAASLPADAKTSFTVLSVTAAAIGIIWLSMTKKPAGAAAVTAVFELPLYLIYHFRPSLMEGILISLADTISIYKRFLPFVDGLFDLGAIIYDISLMLLMLFMSAKVLEYRRTR